MSKLFFDHLVNLDDVETEIKKVTKTHEEREELWQIVDEIVQHRILGCILDVLPEEHHEEFLERFHDAPYDLGILEFLVEKIGEKIEGIIKGEVGSIVSEILSEIKGIETEAPRSSEKK